MIRGKPFLRRALCRASDSYLVPRPGERLRFSPYLALFRASHLTYLKEIAQVRFSLDLFRQYVMPHISSPQIQSVNLVINYICNYAFLIISLLSESFFFRAIIQIFSNLLPFAFLLPFFHLTSAPQTVMCCGSSTTRDKNRDLSLDQPPHQISNTGALALSRIGEGKRAGL